jgi:Coenzyme PQQ synthesis protein D (PqqD)
MLIRIPDEVIFRVLGDEAVILNLATGKYFGLNSVGTRLWQLIVEHGSEEKVIEGFLAEYEVEEKLFRQDLADLIRQLMQTGLVQSEAPKSSQAF